MYDLYKRTGASMAKWEAQSQLQGRTHYVDDDTLRYHHARVLSTSVYDNGLLYSIIESCAIDPDNTSRTFRYVIFDLFGTVIARPDLDQGFTTSAKASKARWAKLDEIDAVAVTQAGMDSLKKNFRQEMEDIDTILAEMA